MMYPTWPKTAMMAASVMGPDSVAQEAQEAQALVASAALEALEVQAGSAPPPLSPFLPFLWAEVGSAQAVLEAMALGATEVDLEHMEAAMELEVGSATASEMVEMALEAVSATALEMVSAETASRLVALQQSRCWLLLVELARVWEVRVLGAPALEVQVA